MKEILLLRYYLFVPLLDSMDASFLLASNYHVFFFFNSLRCVGKFDTIYSLTVSNCLIHFFRLQGSAAAASSSYLNCTWWKREKFFLSFFALHYSFRGYFNKCQIHTILIRPSPLLAIGIFQGLNSVHIKWNAHLWLQWKSVIVGINKIKHIYFGLMLSDTSMMW